MNKCSGLSFPRLSIQVVINFTKNIVKSSEKENFGQKSLATPLITIRGYVGDPESLPLQVRDDYNHNNNNDDDGRFDSKS